MNSFQHLSVRVRLMTLAAAVALPVVGASAFASLTSLAPTATHAVVGAAVTQSQPASQTQQQEAERKKKEAEEKEKQRLRDLAKQHFRETILEISRPGGSTAEPILDEETATPAPIGAQAFAAPVDPGEKVEGPHIVFEKSVHDFGTVLTKQQLTCTFHFTNKGTQKLIIEKVNTGCGCTVANMPKQEFMPGESGTIGIVYDPKGTGNQNRAVQVLTNDAIQRVTTIALEATVLPLVEARPNTVQFGQVLAGEKRTVEVVIVSRDPDATIEAVSTNGPEVSVTEVLDRLPQALVETELPGRKVFDVSLTDEADVGRVLKMITFKVKAGKEKGDPNPEIHEVRVNAFASVKGELNVQPPFIRIRPLGLQEPFEREAIITREGGKDFKIEKVEILNATIEGVTAEVVPYEAPGVKGYKIIIRGDAGSTAKNFRGSAFVTTDMPKEKTVEIQFSGLIRPPVLPASASN